MRVKNQIRNMENQNILDELKNKIMTKLENINRKRQELEKLEKEYLSETPPCNNKKCSFYRSESQSGKCSWSVLLEECKDYLPE